MGIWKNRNWKIDPHSQHVIDDLKKDRGIALIDPHGDTCETVLDYIPSHRINDTVYFNPADKDNPITLDDVLWERLAE